MYVGSPNGITEFACFTSRSWFNSYLNYLLLNTDCSSEGLGHRFSSFSDGRKVDMDYGGAECSLDV